MRSPIIVALCVAFWVGLAPAQDAPKEKEAAPAATKAAASALPKGWRESLAWRSIGPANMGGRIVSFAVVEKDPKRWWAATASGGLLKTVNNGVSFEHQFDKEKVASIGDVAVSQSNPDIVWVGTGECNPRNSVSWGNGVYKSVDGGQTWKHVGLADSFQISSVRIHPANPDVVYVGALGRLWGPNEERGLFKTVDGGKTWTKVLYIDDKTGVVDVQVHPKDPDTLLVATWERARDGFDTNDPAKKWGPGGGLWRTTDGGKSFQKITKGLPTGAIGRIGLDFSRSNPDHVFMVLECDKLGTAPPDSPFLGITGTNADVGARLTQITKGGPAEKAGLKVGDIVIALDGKTLHSYDEFIRVARRHVAGDTVELEISRARKGQAVKVTLGTRPKPKLGKGQKPDPRRGSPFAVFLGGQRQNMQDQQGKEGHEYGGIYKSADGGVSWTRVNSLNPRPMYFSEIRVDPSDEKRIYVLGIRCWKSADGGATFTPDATDGSVHVDHHAMWVNPADQRHVILGNDGGLYVTYDRCKTWDHLNTVAIGQFYHVAVGPREDYRVYGGLQDNGSWGGPGRSPSSRGPTNRDWVRVGGGDGFVCRVDPKDADLVYFTSQNGAIGRRHFKTGERAGMRPRPDRGAKPYRFNWNTPFILSAHNTKIYYAAGNHVFRSLDRGNGLRSISPEITHTDRGSATALAESPVDANVLYVGTDDGALWMTKDGGHAWIDVFAAKPAPAPKPAPKPGPEMVKADAPEANGNGHGKTNGNGAGDAKRPPRQGRAARMYDRMMGRDANGDGALQKNELPERMADLFDRMDADKNGVVTPAELDAGVRAMAGPPAANADAAASATPAGKPLSELMPERRCVSSIEASRVAAGRAYVAFDGHRSNDDRPLIFVTEDFGATWRSITGNLPADAGSTRVLREDITNGDILYLGTEFGAWCSMDRGATWLSLKTNLPTVAVHAFAQHGSNGDLIAATHGRSLWVLDVTTLRQMKAADAQKAFLFQPKPATQWRPAPGRGAARSFVGVNPPGGAIIHYALPTKAAGVKLEITDPAGKTLRTLDANGAAGLHRVTWDLRRMGQSRRRFGPRVQPGTYKIKLTIGEEVLLRDVVVANDPAAVSTEWIELENEAEALEEDYFGEEEGGDDGENVVD